MAEFYRWRAHCAHAPTRWRASRLFRCSNFVVNRCPSPMRSTSTAVASVTCLDPRQARPDLLDCRSIRPRQPAARWTIARMIFAVTLSAPMTPANTSTSQLFRSFTWSPLVGPGSPYECGACLVSRHAGLVQRY